jgi:predicted acyl esterase
MAGRLAVVVVVALAAAMAGCLHAKPDRPADAGGPIRFSVTSVFAGTYDKSGDWSHVLEPGTYAIGEPTIERLVSDYDGVDLVVELVRPVVPDGVKVPVILQGSPYLFGGMTPEGMKTETAYAQLAVNYVPHGYAVALVAVRGTSDQGGCMDLMGKAERADLDQAVTWVATQPWSNGNVGMVGVSYDGSTPWEVAAMGNPHLKTIVPMSGVNDVWSVTYHNGSVQWFGPGGLVALYYGYGFNNYNAAQGTRSEAHMADAVACPESWKGLAASEWATGFVSRDEPTGFFAERDLRPAILENYRGSVFWVHGLRDFRVDPMQGYEMIHLLEERRPDVPVKTLLGQWDHGWPDAVAYHPEAVHEYARWDWAEILLHWFDHELKGDASVDVGPRVQVEDSLRGWRNEEQWPPADASPTKFYLGPNGGLSTEGQGGSADLVVGPNPDDDSTQYFAALVLGQDLPVLDGPCPTCPAFETAPFDEEVRIAGMPELDVITTPTGPGGHIAAFLYMVKDGQAQRIGRGQVDLRLAGGGETPQTVVPNQPLVAKVPFEPMDAALPAGSTLRLVLTQGAYEERLPSTPTYPVKVTAGGTGGPGAESSVMTVGLFERSPDRLFTKP